MTILPAELNTGVSEWNGKKCNLYWNCQDLRGVHSNLNLIYVMDEGDGRILHVPSADVVMRRTTRHHRRPPRLARLAPAPPEDKCIRQETLPFRAILVTAAGGN